MPKLNSAIPLRMNMSIERVHRCFGAAWRLAMFTALLETTAVPLPAGPAVRNGS